MSTKIKPSEAVRTVSKMILEAAIPGLRHDVLAELGAAAAKADDPADYFANTSVSWRREVWALECNLYVRYDENKVNVTWSSTGRTPAQAVAAIRLYTAVTDLACLVQAYLEGVEIEKPEGLR